MKTRIYERQRQIEHEKRASERKGLVGSGDRSQRIRTYNFPQNRVTDHRLNQNFNLDQILAGRLNLLFDAMAERVRQERREWCGSSVIKLSNFVVPYPFIAKRGECMAEHPPNKSDEEVAWTVGRLLTWTTEWLGRQGSESPRLDAEVLLACVRECPRILLYTAFDEVVDGECRQKFRDLVRRRGQGEPVAYLVGSKEFFLNVTWRSHRPRSYQDLKPRG